MIDGDIAVTEAENYNSDDSDTGSEGMPELEEASCIESDRIHSQGQAKAINRYCNARQRAMDLPPMGIHEDCGLCWACNETQSHNDPRYTDCDTAPLNAAWYGKPFHWYGDHFHTQRNLRKGTEVLAHAHSPFNHGVTSVEVMTGGIEVFVLDSDGSIIGKPDDFCDLLVCRLHTIHSRRL